MPLLTKLKFIIALNTKIHQKNYMIKVARNIKVNYNINMKMSTK